MIPKASIISSVSVVQNCMKNYLKIIGTEAPKYIRATFPSFFYNLFQMPSAFIVIFWHISHVSLLTDQISLSECLYFLQYWEIYVLLLFFIWSGTS